MITAQGEAGHYDSFIVKVWVDDADEIIRGYIQHVSTQETMHFYDLNKMNEFILSHIHSQSVGPCNEQDCGESCSKPS